MNLRIKTLVFVGLLGLFPVAGLAYGQGGHGDHGGGGETVKMGRLRTIGFEAKALTGAGLGNPFFEGSGSAGTTIDTATKRSGNASAQCNSGAGNTTAFVKVELTAAEIATPTPIFARGYFFFDTLPSVTTRVLIFTNITSSAACSARVTSAGKLQLWDDSSNTQVGSDSVTTLATGVWYRIEMSYAGGGTTFSSELRLDGVTVASGSGLSGLAISVSLLDFGWVTAPGAASICHVDDIAVNNNTGTVQNSFPGAGSVRLLIPVSDNSRTGWTAGAGSTTNLFAAVDNEAPAGLTAGSATNTSQIKDVVSSATDNYDTNVQDYLTAGIPSNAIITLAQAVCDEGQGITTGSKSGALQIVSNPAQAAEDSFTYASTLAGAVGAWPTGWEAFWGSPQYSPTVTLSAQPVLRVGKRTATTREVDVDFMGIEVEYTVPLGVVSRLALLGVGH